MFLRPFIERKLPGLIALLLMTTLLSAVLVFYSQADLNGPVSDFSGMLFSLLTHSAGNPGFLVTVGLFMMIPVIMKLPRKTLIKLGTQFALLLALSFIAKTVMKHITEVPRPYTHQLQALDIVETPDAFYTLSHIEKDEAVKQASESVSHWRITHWQGETNYSLPSGHTIFAAVCVAFWGGFFLRRRQFIPVGIIITWAVSVGISRIWLGMHWPTDLLASIFGAACLYLCIPEWRVLPAKMAEQTQQQTFQETK
ncbi:phosphatase PAP2 family protein [Photobacterium sp. DNB23_23_1]|uniref:undecaprenyl-diphosphate phosphatase n=1 Tax=Photobacterium pectinilyticum TaxID=2906793 RepID=A0ABT1N2I4_9GAMM|nr:phosphatase PAP2 family protein [Photobacterium sp. ZSDE20]MCQ1058953.1 phosphatase PAP2 family protein [Photobacterium sp. ZSDE20]MDD1824032.1 phosphatase PAP2 family protein [Photobacterium sp. ZSDE20]